MKNLKDDTAAGMSTGFIMILLVAMAVIVVAFPYALAYINGTTMTTNLTDSYPDNPGLIFYPSLLGIAIGCWLPLLAAAGILVLRPFGPIHAFLVGAVLLVIGIFIQFIAWATGPTIDMIVGV